LPPFPPDGEEGEEGVGKEAAAAVRTVVAAIRDLRVPTSTFEPVGT